MADNVLGGDTDPLSPSITPGAQTALGGGDEDAEERAYQRERRKQVREEYGRQIEREKRFEAREEEQYRRQEEEMRPRRAALEQAEEGYQRTAEQQTRRLQSRQVDVPKFDANAARGDAMAWMSLAAGFGAIAGGFSRYHTTTALNAFSGMMNGFAKGQIEVYNQKYKEWEANADQAHEYNQRALDEYKQIMNNAKINVDVKSNLMQMTAEKWHDDLMATQAQQRSIERMIQLMEAQDRTDANMQIKRDAMAAHNEQVQRGLDLKQQHEDASLAARGLKRDENGNIVRDPNAVASGTTWQKQAFLDWRDEYVQKNGHPPSAAEERQFGQTLSTVRSAQAMALQKFMSENPNATSKDVIAFSAQLAGDVAAIRAAGNRAGQIAVSADEADSTFPLALQASAAFPRYKWQPLNRLYEDAATLKSDPRFRVFMASNEAAVTAYGATMSRSGGNTVAAQTRAHAVLDTADSVEAYAAGIKQLQKEIDQVRTAPARARVDLLKTLGLAPEGTTAPNENTGAVTAPAPPAPPAPGGGGGTKQDLGGGWTGTVGQ